MELRTRFINVMYIVFLLFFVLQKIYVEKNLHKIELYDELRYELLETQSLYDCLELKHKVVREYADGWGYNIDWDKAVQIAELERIIKEEKQKK